MASQNDCDDLIDEIVESELESMGDRELRSFYRSFRRADLEALDSETVESIHHETTEGHE